MQQPFTGTQAKESKYIFNNFFFRSWPDKNVPIHKWRHTNLDHISKFAAFSLVQIKFIVLPHIIRHIKEKHSRSFFVGYLKMTISTGVWGAKHPNAGQNIQHSPLLSHCLHSTLTLTALVSPSLFPQSGIFLVIYYYWG